jgi:uncharacterized membrane protein
MDDLIFPILALLVLVMIVTAIVLPIVAIAISISSSRKVNQHLARLAQTPPVSNSIQQSPIPGSVLAAVQQLEARVETLEAALGTHAIPIRDPTTPVVEPRREPATEPTITPSAAPAIPVEIFTGPPRSPITASGPTRTIRTEQLESVIGRRWLGWAAVCVILFAAAFFLKYAFDNRWIGELGRVAVGVAAGVGMTAAGYKYHRRRWRIFSQILTGGGIVLLYLSVYAAFGYYHLASQKAAFVYLAILVAEAACLAMLYDAPAIAIMALIGGFLNPILLRTDRDQYRSLFGYIAALDLGALALLKHWPGLGSLAFAGTHLLFWLWYGDKYHPRKLGAVMVFQTVVFLIFLLAHLGKQLLKRQTATFEDLGLLVINPFVFFATAYHLLNPAHHDWMGVFAIGMALIYAGAARLLLDQAATTRMQSLLLIGVALTFVTLAIPIQLQSNWITIAWAFEAVVMLWVGIETNALRLRVAADMLFGLTLFTLVFWDTPGGSRGMFTPVLNKYFLSSLIVTGCLLAAAFLYQKAEQRKQIFAPPHGLIILFVAIVTLWWVMSVETYTFFAARASARKLAEDASHERWLGQMALSVLWSVYAATLAALGFARRSAAMRWAALALFGLTVIKAMLVDIAGLQQLYRIIVFLVLGVLLLLVAWGYQKAFHSRESLK